MSEEQAEHVIWKFPIPVQDVTTIEVPGGASQSTPLSVVRGESSAVLWVYLMVKPDLPVESVRVFVHGTGHPVHWDTRWNGRFVGTVVDPPWVWHVWVEHR